MPKMSDDEWIVFTGEDIRQSLISDRSQVESFENVKSKVKPGCTVYCRYSDATKTPGYAKVIDIKESDQCSSGISIELEDYGWLDICWIDLPL